MNQLLSVVISATLRMLALLPLRAIKPIAGVIGKVLWYANSNAKKVALENLELCFPDMNDVERQRIARVRMQHLCMTALELAPLSQWPLDKILQHTHLSEQDSLLDKLVAQGKGVILLAPHYGNWEALGVYVGSKHRLVCLYQPPKIAVVDHMFNQSRLRFCAELAPTNANGVKMLLKALRRGEVVGILPDQVPPPGSGEFAPFFGVPALTMTLVHNLVQRTGAPVLMAYTKRVDNDKYFQPVFQQVPQAVYSSDLSQSLCAMNESVERAVLQCPEQYQWEYKRFKRQPDGQKRYR